jgi:iron(III) transport system substrate-binding protein
MLLVLGGCGGASGDEQRVVLYTSVDQPIAEPIVREFEKRNPGISVLIQTDAEANKTVGLVERLRAEKANPQADVYWGNEPFHAVRLAEEGVLAAYDSPAGGDVPEQFKDVEHRWCGNALRARVIAVHPGGAAAPRGLEDLPKMKSLAIARPTAGTTGSHVAALYVLWGNDRADAYFRKLHDAGVKLLGGNGPVAEAVGQGQFEAGLTDNDDVASAQREGGTLERILPDQDSIGTLALPTSVALVAGAKHPEPARKLIDYLLSVEVEKKLIEVQFAGWSVRKGSEQDDAPKWMQVDYRVVAREMPEAVRRATSLLEGRS